jgi:hypothetical protein
VTGREASFLARRGNPPYMNTRTIAVIALVLVVIVLVILLT